MTTRESSAAARERVEDIAEDWREIGNIDPEHIDWLLNMAGLLCETREHLEELRDAWERGAISEHDGKGGTRSNRNAELEARLRAALAPISQPDEPCETCGDTKQKWNKGRTLWEPCPTCQKGAS